MQPEGGVAIATAMHMTEQNADSAMQDAWQSAMGYRPQGARLVDLLWDQLTAGSDPSGESGPKPLMPTVSGELELHVPGHSLVKSERFRFGIHPHTNRVQDVLRRDFEKTWERTNGHDHCRRVLDFTCEKYRVNEWREFVPQRLHAHVPGRLPHATTITDHFQRSDADALGNSSEGWSWSELTGDMDITNNSFAYIPDSSTGILCMARANSDLSGTDHYSQVLVRSQSDFFQNAGAVARKDDTATITYYAGRFFWSNGSQSGAIHKVVTGTATSLASASQTLNTTSQYTAELEANGSNLSLARDGSAVTSVTDTAISGGLRCGMAGQRHASGGTVSFDNFEAADLAVATAGGRVLGEGFCGGPSGGFYIAG